MRIVYLIHGLNNGGAEKVAAELSRIWSELGHEVFLLTQSPSADREYSHRCEARECIPYLSITDKTVQELKRRYKFDLVVFNDAINDESFPRVFSMFRALPDTRVAIIIHHTANNWLYTLGNTQELDFDEEYAKADAVICVDKMWALWWHHRGARSFFIPNPVSISTVAGEKTQIGAISQKYQIVWVGRLMDWAKQPEKMVAAFVEVCSQVPAARLVMLGSKTRTAERKLLHNVPKKLRTKIEFPGFVTDADRYMRESALHAFTSLTEVTVPQVILEARAVGLKTIALDMPVLRNVEGVEIARDTKDFIRKIIDELNIQKEYVLSAIQNQDNLVCKWKILLDALSDDDKLFHLSRQNQDLWQTPENYDLLVDELSRSQRYFVHRHLPELIFFRRWKTRLSIRYLVSKTVEKSLRRMMRRK